jgi:hypothetical protein
LGDFPPTRFKSFGNVKEPVVVLDELREGLLQDVGSVLEVGERVEDFAVQAVERRLPGGVEVGNDSPDPRFESTDIKTRTSAGLPMFQGDLGLFDELDLKEMPSHCLKSIEDKLKQN